MFSPTRWFFEIDLQPNPMAESCMSEFSRTIWLLNYKPVERGTSLIVAERASELTMLLIMLAA